jgi:hypothetical protein
MRLNAKKRTLNVNGQAAMGVLRLRYDLARMPSEHPRGGLGSLLNGEGESGEAPLKTKALKRGKRALPKCE